MFRHDPIVRLSVKALNAALLALVLVGTLIGAIALYPFYHNLRDQALDHFQRHGEMLAAQLHGQLEAMRDIAAQVTSRTKARTTLEDFNQGRLNRDQARPVLNDILSDVLRQSPQVLGVWRFDAQGEPLAGVGMALPSGLTAPASSAKELRLYSFRPAQNGVLLLVDAPIRDRNNLPVGTDRVLFSSQGLAETLQRAVENIPHSQVRLFDQGRVLFSQGRAPVPDSALQQTEFAIDPAGLHLQIQLAQSELYRLAQWQTLRLGLFLLVLMGLGGLGIGLLGRHFLRALREEIGLRQLREQDLLASEQRFRALVQSSNLAMLVMDDSDAGHIGLINHRFSELFGFSPTQLRDLEDWWRLAYAEGPERQAARQAWQQAIAQLDRREPGSDPRTPVISSEVRCADGSLRSIELSMSRQHGFSLLIFNDLTQERQIQKQLQLAASVFSHASEGIVITSPEARILDVNQSFSRITGYPRGEVLGQDPALLKSGRHDLLFYKALWKDLLELGHWTGEIWNRRKNGEIYVELLTINAVYDQDQRLHHYVGLFSDITQARAHQDQLERIAHYDALTNLPNRSLLADRMQQAMLQTQRRNDLLAVVFLDLDGFKEINDRHGHEAGDELLICLSKRLHDAVREGDSVARLGGDEFVALLIDILGKKDVEPLLERLLVAASQPVHLGQEVLQVSASLGVTFYPQAQPVDAEQLLRQADNAMYQAKQSGKNRYRLYDAERDQPLQGFYESLARIRQALEQNELLLHYQPKVNLRSGTLIGVEALLRWRHPERGLLLPNDFLGLAEDDPLAIDIDLWVLRNALAQLALWHRAGLRLRLSVNLGPLLLQQADFLSRITNLLQQAGVVGDWLELEVLESHALQDMRQIGRLIEECRALGIHCALDDFGTGYSSLTYLRRLPADTLKIDPSFVRDMLDDPDDLAILEGILGLASAFNREAVAVGAETEAHCAMLLQLGCELAQGYAISPALPAEQLLAWAQVWQPNPEWRAIIPVNRLNQSLLAAGIQHRAWVKQVQDLIENGSTLPMQHFQDCPFQNWLDGEGKNHFSQLDGFAALAKLHRQVHEQGQQITNLANSGQAYQAQQRLPELLSLRDALLQQLQLLLRATQA
jgi:diguanylate cyclase (GGDEF)-like protein/PAS domain S-box-containing protein